MAGKILVPQVGTEPMAPALEAWSLNYWTTRQVTGQYFLYIILIIPLMIFFLNLFLTFLVVILGLTCGQFTVFMSHPGKLSLGKVLGRASGQESCLKKGGLRDGPQAGGLSQGDGHRVVAPGYRLQL